MLLVEDDDVLALALHRDLYRNSDLFDVMIAATAEIGRELMREIYVDVLVADVQLPGMSGLDLIRWAAIESPQSHFIVMTGAGLSEIRDRTCDVGCVHVLQKPFEPAELHSLVLEAIESRERLTGSLTALSVVDLIQMLCLGRKNALVRITCKDIISNLLIRSGALVHATWKEKVGEAAVREMIGATEGVFRIAPLPGGIPATITRDWAHVVMDAVRALDEQGKDPLRSSDSWPALSTEELAFDDTFGTAPATGGTRSTGTHVAVADVTLVADARDAGNTARAAASLLDQGFSALRAGELDQARSFWQAARKLEPDNRIIELNLRKLEAMQSR